MFDNDFDTVEEVECSTCDVDKVEELKAWTIRNNISRNALTDLFQTLNKVGVNDLPLSAKTLLGTVRDRVEVKDIQGGEFLDVVFQSIFLQYSERVDIGNVGIDGLQLTKSSKNCVWPILGSIVNYLNVGPSVYNCLLPRKKQT